MIATGQEFVVTQERIAYFERLLGQLRATATPEEFGIMASGYRTELERMQAELVDWLTRPLDSQARQSRVSRSRLNKAIHLKGEKEAEAQQYDKPLYDQIWCVFDRDLFDPGDFNNAICKAISAGFQVAYTNEAFELWYLLHFDDHRAALQRGQYAVMLKDRLGHEYRKNSQAMYAELLKQQVEAIHRAESLRAEYGTGHNPQQDDPCTTVHLLVKALRENSSPRPQK